MVLPPAHCSGRVQVCRTLAPMNNHRGQLRYSVTGRGQFQAGTQPSPVGVRLVDISEAGISFLCDLVVAIGARGTLAFSVLGEGGPIACAPTVAVQTCVLEKRMYRIGALFVDNDDAVTGQIRTVIAARAKVVKGR